jgi:hypothetical protein
MADILPKFGECYPEAADFALKQYPGIFLDVSYMQILTKGKCKDVVSLRLAPNLKAA